MTSNPTAMLRRTLLGNAAFSAIAGASLILAPDRLSGALIAAPEGPFGLSVTSVCVLLGAGLILFALDVLIVATRRALSPLLVRVITGLDWAWVCASALLLLVAPDALTLIGAVAVAVAAALTAVFALAQRRALRDLTRYPGIETRWEGGQLLLRTSREVDADPARAWAVISDHEGYADVADNLSKVELLGGSGMGMKRRCYDTRGRGWNERCVQWEEGRRYSFVVDTTAPDYPYPIAELQGTWGIEPAGARTRIVMEFRVRPKRGVLGSILTRAMVGPFERTCDQLLTNWAGRMHASAQGDTHRQASRTLATAAHP